MTTVLAETLTQMPVPPWLRIVAGVLVILICILGLGLAYATPLVPRVVTAPPTRRWWHRDIADAEDDEEETDE